MGKTSNNTTKSLKKQCVNNVSRSGHRSSSQCSASGIDTHPPSAQTSAALNVSSANAGYAVTAGPSSVNLLPTTTYSGVFINNVVFIPGVMYVQK